MSATVSTGARAPRGDGEEPHFAIAVRPGPDGSSLATLDGEFDLAGYEPFMQVLARVVAEGTALTIDAHGVVYIDSTGLRGLLQARNLLGQERVHIIRPSEAVAKLLTATGTRHLFQVDGLPEG